MTTTERRPTYVRHDDDEWIDEVRIVTVPRWKESELSGDEWRFSTRIELYRKGVLLATCGGGRVRDAVALLPFALRAWGGGSHLGDAFESEPERPPGFWDEFCSNPACPEQAVIEYRLMHHYCHEGHAHDAEWRNDHARFCERHKRRGDCGLNDSDRNYVVVAIRRADGTWHPIETQP